MARNIGTPMLTPMIHEPSDGPPTDSPWGLEVELGGEDGEGTTFAMMGGVTTASTAIATPVTLASIAVALLGLLVALAIADCTEVAIAVGVRMRTPTMTLPDVTVTITADGSTPARAAIAPFISVRTLGVKEETSPASRRAKSTALIAGGGLEVELGGGGAEVPGAVDEHPGPGEVEQNEPQS